MILKEFKELIKDYQHSASYITNKTLEVTKKALLEDNIDKKELLSYIEKIAKAHSQMASIYNLYLFLKDNLDIDKINKYQLKLKDNEIKTIKNASRFLKNFKKIAIYSYSSLVKKALNSLDKQKIQILISEARPINEGKTLCQELQKDGFNVILTTDALLASMLKEVDILLLGADGITKEYLIHKAGTLPLTLSAKYFNKKVITIAPPNKFFPKEYTPSLEETKPSNQIDTLCKKIKNLYFDQTPLKFIDKIISS